MLTIIFNSITLAICWGILLRNGELFQGVARHINMSDYDPLFRKLALCPHCVAGQLALWQCVFKGDHWMSIPVSIIFVFYFKTIMHEKGN